MSRDLSTTKSILAKLLATENINIVQKSCKTASFDLKTRTLYLPTWEDMDGELFDLLTGHEVGHALFTPSEGWHDAIVESSVPKKFKSFLNVVEDARIEKLIKRKFPGLSKSFAMGYRDLHDRDFFGVKKINLSRLNIIDRINLYFKVGSYLIVPFSDEERDLVREVSELETWTQVVELSTRLYEYAKKEKDLIQDCEDLTEELLKQFEDGELDDMLEEMEYEEDSEGQQASAEEDAEEDAEDGADATEESQELDEETVDSDGVQKQDSDEDSDEDEDEESSQKSAGQGDSEEDEEEEEPESVTDSHFRQREEELIVDDVCVFNYTLPEPQLKWIILPNKNIRQHFYTGLSTKAARSNIEIDVIKKDSQDRFNKANKNYISLLIKEFEMRKNASQYARTQTSKTGELDMSKLHQYKYSNDLFKKMTITDKGKSHGLIMFVDMSGSMRSYYGQTIEQSLILATFCKKVGIPFDIYGFSDSTHDLHYMNTTGNLPEGFRTGRRFIINRNEEYQLKDQNFHLKHILSSTLNSREYRLSFDMLLILAMNYKHEWSYRDRANQTTSFDPHWDFLGFSLGGTPFIPTLLASRKIIDEFNSLHKVDITNVIYLTDGDGFGALSAKMDDYDEVGKRIYNKTYFTDRKTKKRALIPFRTRGGGQKELTAFIRDITGCRHIGYFISKRSEIRLKFNAYLTIASPEQAEIMKRTMREDNYFSAPSMGYDNYYYTVMSGKYDDEGYELNESMTPRRMSVVFSKSQNTKRNNRNLISKFAKEIATP